MSLSEAWTRINDIQRARQVPGPTPEELIVLLAEEQRLGTRPLCETTAMRDYQRPSRFASDAAEWKYTELVASWKTFKGRKRDDRYELEMIKAVVDMEPYPDA